MLAVMLALTVGNMEETRKQRDPTTIYGVLIWASG